MSTQNEPNFSRRKLLWLTSAAAGIGMIGGVSGALWWAADSVTFQTFLQRRRREALVELIRRVLPPSGYETQVTFGDAIQRLTAAGVISPEKFRRLYAQRGGLPAWVERLFKARSNDPIVLSLGNAPFLLNLLWPVGLATETRFNEKSRINGARVGSFASTGGWILGNAKRGGRYFNSVRAVDLEPSQEDIIVTAARNSYRPCCNNSTFFQDCNHGSALLGLYELAAAQGATLDQLYAVGRLANSYWYPDQYVETAVYFEQIRGRPWNRVPPADVLGADYSSIAGWKRNVHAPLVEAGIVPAKIGATGGGGCGV